MFEPDTLMELKARLEDAAEISVNRDHASFTGFLDERQAQAARSYAQARRFANYIFWGGYPGAERVFFGSFPDFQEPREDDFPISALTFSYRCGEGLCHRNFLGALLHLGVKRSAIGDILVEDGRCVVFCRSEISDFILSQVTKIGGVGVRITAGASMPLPAAHRFEDFSGVIASARLDCAVAVASRTSREKTVELIRASMVLLNHEICNSPSAGIREGDVLSIRGCGRFILDRLGPVTKKGKLGIAGRKYV